MTIFYKGLELPDEPCLIIRSSIAAICYKNKPAVYVLSALLGHVPSTHKDGIFPIQRTQEELVEDVCRECSVKTIHDTALPFLLQCGYVSLDETTQPTTYFLHGDRIQEALEAYNQGHLASRNPLPVNIRKLLAQHNREAKKRGLPATLTARQWNYSVQYFHSLCAYCQQTPYSLLEHFIPVNCGGGTTFNNCVPACYSCNAAKGGWHPLHLPTELFTTSPKLQRIAQSIERVHTYLITCGSEAEK